MPSLSFGKSSYERSEGDMPELPCINMYAEQAPTETTGVVLQSRRGLDDRGADMGAGPVEALFQRDGILTGSLFGVSAGALYRASTSLGGVTGSGAVSIAGNEIGLMTTAGAVLYFYNGTTLAAVSFPDGASVTKVLVGGSRYIALRANTGQFYWTPALGSTFAALDFATAESSPDALRDALYIDDILILFGSETVEYWPNTGSATLPFQPLEGRVIEKGIRATGCATAYGPTFAWVTNENKVCLQDESTVLSNPGLQAKIEASTDVRLFTFLQDGEEFLALRLDTETQVWHGGQWSEFTSYGQDNWIPQCSTGSIFGSAVDGKTLTFGEGYSDLGGTLERRFRGGTPINSGGLMVGNMGLRCNPGQTPFLTGDYAEPYVEMRLSRDAGQTWGNFRKASLGRQGEYRKKVQWRACGMASQPALLAEFRVTAPVPFRNSDVLINEPNGGR